jgi:hypothetical protein
MAARQRRCRIAEEWQSFREAALGGGVPPIQLSPSEARGHGITWGVMQTDEGGYPVTAVKL